MKKKLKELTLKNKKLRSQNKKLTEALTYMLEWSESQLQDQYQGWDHAEQKRPAALVYYDFLYKEVMEILHEKK
jgi:hypothetical protein